MNASTIITNVLKTLKRNSPEILTALGVSGVVTTSYLASRASFKAAEVIKDSENEHGYATESKERFKIRTKLVWKLYIPPAVSGAVTIACIVGASKSNNQRTAAAVTAYSLTERAFSDYKEKVVEQIGKGKEQKIRDEIVQDRVSKNPVGSAEMVMVSGDNVLCCELLTMRYLRSDMETLRKAQNEINMKINHELYVVLDELYDILGLAHTSVSDKIGWDSDRLLELKFSHALSEDGKPCLTFDYNYTKPI